MAAYAWVLVPKVPVPPGALDRGLGGLELRPVRAVHAEGEGALGELGAGLIVHQPVRAEVIQDLEKSNIRLNCRVKNQDDKEASYLSVLALVVPVALDGVREEPVELGTLVRVVLAGDAASPADEEEAAGDQGEGENPPHGSLNTYQNKAFVFLRTVILQKKEKQKLP